MEVTMEKNKIIDYSAIVLGIIMITALISMFLFGKAHTWQNNEECNADHPCATATPTCTPTVTPTDEVTPTATPSATLTPTIDLCNNITAWNTSRVESITIDGRDCPTPTPTAPPTGHRDGLSDGKSDGRSSCADCTKTPVIPLAPPVAGR